MSSHENPAFNPEIHPSNERIAEIAGALAVCQMATLRDDAHPTSFSPRTDLEDLGTQDGLKLLEETNTLRSAYFTLPSGKLDGRLGLEVYDYVWKHDSGRRFWGRRLVDHELNREHASHLYAQPYYHGSPKALAQLENGVLQPRQPLRRDPYTGMVYAHGKPSVCLSDAYEEPILLSLFNKNAKHFQTPALQAQKVTVMRHTVPSPYGLYPYFSFYRNYPYEQWVPSPHHITTRKVLDLMSELNAQGYVFPIDEQALSHGSVSTVRKSEFRFNKPIVPSFGIRVTTADLSPDLLVVEGDREDMLHFKRTWENMSPIEAAQKAGVSVEPLQGYWPEALFQFPDRIH